MIHTIKKDILYQMKYGFYLLYFFMTVIYIGILLLLPEHFKEIGASIIILADPAMLGFFFIGGIWLLEKGEGVHKFYSISPLKPIEYILSKAFSLSIISTFSALGILLLSANTTVDYPLMLFTVFTGSMTFTLFGLSIATFARSVNNYMLISVPVEILIVLPPILNAFGIRHAILGILPGTILLKAISTSIKTSGSVLLPNCLISMILWLGVSIIIALLRIPAALQSDGGERL